MHLKDQSNCDCKPESPEHLSAKFEIIKACQENGWTATPEYAENEWRADVLATKNGKRIAFEIQWSNQTIDDTKVRQDRFNSSNVRGCWFFRTIPKQLRNYGDSYLAVKEMPFFKIEKEGDLTLVSFNQRKWSLHEFVSELLNGRIKFREQYTPQHNQEVEILFFKTICWKCDQIQDLYTVKTAIKSQCKNDMTHYWDEEDIDIYPEVVDLVRDIVQTEKNNDLKVGEIKMRYSNTVEDSYVSHGCYYCDALFGNWFVPKEKKEALTDDLGVTFKRNITFNNFSVASKHWCYSENKDFC